MSTDTISPLRQRMIDDMTARHLGSHTQQDDIRSKRFAAFLKRSPETATADDIRPVSAGSGRERHQHRQSRAAS